MSPQKDQEYFCDGIAEELINALTHVKDLRVVVRTSAFSFKGKDVDVRDIGRTLSVETVLEGSIRKAGNKLRITAQLIKVEDGFHLWSEKFDREMEDIFAIQDEIAKAIVDNLELKLLAQERAAIGKRPTDDPETYNLYLMGLYFTYKLSREASDKALDYFKRAIDRDPDFAPAYVGMASVLMTMGNVGLALPADVFPKAKTAFRRALELDPHSALVHFHVGMAYYLKRELEKAIAAFQKSKAIADFAGWADARIGIIHAQRGEKQEAVKILEDLLARKKITYVSSANIGWLWGALGNFDEAFAGFDAAYEERDSVMPFIHIYTKFAVPSLAEDSRFKSLLKKMKLAEI